MTHTALANLVHLKELDLRNNQIKDLSPLSNLVHLEKLRVENNPLDEIPPFPNLVKLTELDAVIDFSRLEEHPFAIKTVEPPFSRGIRDSDDIETLLVLILIGQKGIVEQVGEIIGPPQFHEAAKEAALQWQFIPGIFHQKKVKTWFKLPFHYTWLRAKAEDPALEFEAEEEELVELWKVEQQPTVKKQVKPIYPEDARKANIEGRVFVLGVSNKKVVP